MDDRKLSSTRVLHIIGGLSLGGAEVALLRLVTRLDRKRFPTAVISLLPLGDLANDLLLLGIPVHSLGLRKGLPNPVALARLRSLAAEFRPDVLQGWMSHGNLVSLCASYLLRPRPHVAWNIRQSIYSLSYETRTTALVIRACAVFSKLVDAIVYNSEVSAIQHETLGYSAANRRLIFNGFDVDKFSPNPSARAELRGRLGLSPHAVLIGNAARYHPMKDHATLLEAFRIVRSNKQDVHLVLAGTQVTNENSDLAKLMRSLGIAEHVTLLGPLKDTARFFAGVDIAVSSSWTESFPNTLAEAMACGVACVATDVGDSARIVGGHGLVVAPRAPSELANGITTLIRLGLAGRLQLGACARMHIQSHFSMDHVTEQYGTLYSTLPKHRVGGDPSGYTS